jgi:hypothetical protein
MSAYVYLIATDLYDGLAAPVKVGVSSDPLRRLSQLQSGSPQRLRIAHLFPLPDRGVALEIERALLAIKHKHRLMGEWLDLEPVIAASLIGLYIGSALASSGINGDELANTMRDVHALPEAGEFKLNLGNV